jgi:hypothetical protein
MMRAIWYPIFILEGLVGLLMLQAVLDAVRESNRLLRSIAEAIEMGSR